MKREEKSAVSRQRILAAAMEEFSRKGYEGASLATTISQRVSFLILAPERAFHHQACAPPFPAQRQLSVERDSHRHPRGGDPDLPCRGHVSDRYCRKAPAGFRPDHRRLRRCPAADPHRLLCGDGLYAGLSAGGLLCLRREKRRAFPCVGPLCPERAGQEQIPMR